MSEVTIIFPHQLFKENPALAPNREVILVEEFLFFNQYSFHKQKIAFHRASMKYYEDYLKNKDYKVSYINSYDPESDVRKLIQRLHVRNVKQINYVNVTDDWLEKRILSSAGQKGMKVTKFETPMFLNSGQEIEDFFEGRKRFFQTDFYKYQRKTKGILMDPDGSPAGGKWTYDAENRKKYPITKVPPEIIYPAQNKYTKEASDYVNNYFAENPGSFTRKIYPVTFDDAEKWLKHFLEQRFYEFGSFEDAIVMNENFLNHSVLSPLLNVGILTPDEVIRATIKYYEKNDVPLNSMEGFIRQIIGWREFMRAVYELKGIEERTKNYWNFKRRIPDSFWRGDTGILPVDSVIKKVLETSYAHHIERLMVLGNFMLLCEFDPDEVYRWFMELFIDAYDWVMVPNVYGMSQFADGGIFATKPYISSSNYLMKMSDYPKGEWQILWDSLFWRFMHVHRDYFSANPRSGMLLRTFDKMFSEKQKLYLDRAKSFLESI